MPEDVGYVHVRRDLPAAVPAEPGDVDRLLRHRHPGHDLDVRCRQHAECAATSRTTQRHAAASIRDANGSLWRGDGNVEDLNINIGSLSTKGWDLSLSYTGVELGGLGELSFNLVGTVLDELITVPGPGIAPVECAGKYSGAHLRHAEPRVAASLPHRLGDAVERGPVAHLALLRRRDEHRRRPPRPTSTTSRRAQNYFDLAANWAVTEKASVLRGHQQRAGQGSAALLGRRYYG